MTADEEYADDDANDADGDDVVYEAGDVNTVAGGSATADDGYDDEYDDGDEFGDEAEDEADDLVDEAGDADAINEDDEDDEDDEGNAIDAANRSTGGTPKAVLTYLARSLAGEPDEVVVETEERRRAGAPPQRGPRRHGPGHRPARPDGAGHPHPGQRGRGPRRDQDQRRHHRRLTGATRLTASRSPHPDRARRGGPRRPTCSTWAGSSSPTASRARWWWSCGATCRRASTPARCWRARAVPWSSPPPARTRAATSSTSRGWWTGTGPSGCAAGCCGPLRSRSRRLLWVHELVGAEVVAADGRVLGTVAAVEANPASDLLVLEGGGLIPLRFVTGHRARVRVTVDIPDGLLD